MNCITPETTAETLDPLNRRLYLIQHKHGHRATSDDVLLAGFGLAACPDAVRALDLGSGKGTVALLCLSVAQKLQKVIGIEAVLSAHQLAQRNAVLNHLENKYFPIFADLRDAKVLQDEPPFDLILGAPPFMPMGTGVLPKNPERAAGRFEIRGGIEDYAQCAVQHLAPNGRAVLLMDGLGEKRAFHAISHAGLQILEQIRVVPRPSQPSTYCIFITAHSSDSPINEREFCMRGADGEAWSDEYAALRATLDLPSSAR